MNYLATLVIDTNPHIPEEPDMPRTSPCSLLAAACLAAGCTPFLSQSTPNQGEYAGLEYTVNPSANFKKRPVPSEQLAPEEKCAIPTGTVITLSAPVRDAGQNQVWMSIASGLPESCGFTDGYMYAKYIGLDFEPRSRPEKILTASTDTWFKRRNAQAADLEDNDKCLLKAGESFGIKGELRPASHMHFKASAVFGLKTCPFQEGFFYSEHFGLPYKAPGAKVTTTTATYLKAKPVPSADLDDSSRCTIPAGVDLKLAVPARDGGKNHAYLEIMGGADDCPFWKGYVYAPHVGLDFPVAPPPPPPSASGAVDLPVAYQAQPTSSWCQITSLAMALSYLGFSNTPHTILGHGFSYSQGQTPNGLASMAKALGAGGSYPTTTFTDEQIKAELRAGHPVVVFGCFTNSGHVVLVKGYNDKGYIVNDPWGAWNGCVFANPSAGCGNFPNDGCGSGYTGSANGAGLVYSYEAFARGAREPGGFYWATVVAK